MAGQVCHGLNFPNAPISRDQIRQTYFLISDINGLHIRR
jgi:hypothetical protein